MLIMLNLDWPSLPAEVREQRKSEIAKLIDYMVRRKPFQYVSRSAVSGAPSSHAEAKRVTAVEEVTPKGDTVVGYLRRQSPSSSSSASFSSSPFSSWCIELQENVSSKLLRYFKNAADVQGSLKIAIGHTAECVPAASQHSVPVPPTPEWVDGDKVQFELVHLGIQKNKFRQQPPLDANVPLLAVQVMPIQHVIRGAKVQIFDRLSASGCILLPSSFEVAVSDDSTMNWMARSRRFFVNQIDLRLRPSDLLGGCLVDVQMVSDKILSIHPAIDVVGSSCSFDKNGRFHL